MRFSTITRSRGKCLLALTGPSGAEGLMSRSRTSDGRLLPSRLVRDEDGGLVVSVPVLDVTQKIDVLPAGNASSRPLCRKSVSRRGSSARSKINAVLRNPRAQRLRSSGALAREDGVAARELFLDGDRAVLRGSVSLVLREGDDLLSRALDMCAVECREGRVISEGWTCLGDVVRDHPEFPGMRERMVEFSLSLPADTSELILWARPAGSEETIGFAVLFPEWMGALREEWEGRLRAADREPGYERWFSEQGSSSEFELALQRRAQHNLPERPSFSIVVPLFETPLDFLEEMASSVLAQTYDNFELVLVNASPENDALSRAVSELCERDERVRCVPLEGNLGITENTNAGIRAATGDFLVFVDHDDTIEPDALYRYALEVSRRPDTDLVYCDEDHLMDGRLVSPFFKPDWDEELLCAENYVCHMLAVRRSVVMGLPELPGREFDGSQDHNLTFLVGERARHVAHVARVLYHWRIHERSVAGAGVEQKPYALDAELRAVGDHLRRAGIPAEVRMGKSEPSRCEVTYEFGEHPLVSIVIPSHDAAPVLRRCLDSLFTRLTWPNFEVVLVENGSREEETFALYDEVSAKHDNVRVVTCELENGFNFSRLVNVGAAAARGEYLLLLNNDTEVISPDTLELMVGPAQREGVGCVGAKLLYPDGLIQHAGVTVGRADGPHHVGLAMPASALGYYETLVLPREASAVTAACVLVPRRVFDEVGGFDESLPVDFNDVDFCLRVRSAGYAIVQQQRALMYHYESVSRGTVSVRTRAQLVRFVSDLGVYLDRWGAPLMLGDPYYNKNFAFENVYCGLETDRYPGGEPSLANFV